ncbi:hypothetical protein CK500_09350 [Halorubrum salipaludis]|uniref:Uncharacterized protein n=1 Tax=Halorubrum salipaludis TaxID=2032630 RepID=A0A2A2FG30_9EURY|nr:hypothetical protein CK500_09350 [Halorubrum salipaludis]
MVDFSPGARRTALRGSRTVAGESGSQPATRLERHRIDAGRDPERLTEAVAHDRDAAGPTIWPA